MKNLFTKEKTDASGYTEFYNDHYFKWNKSQSQKYKDYRAKWEKNTKNFILEEFPLHLDIGITNVCNLGCTFCARTVRVDDNNWRESKHMDFDLFKKIITEAAELGTYSINMNLLNEPLIHPQVIEMIKFAKEQGIVDIHFHTHGGLLTENMSEKLIDSGVDRLFISIDSPYKEKYNKLRVNSDFDKVINNLKKFKELRDSKEKIDPLIRVSMIAFPDISETELIDAKNLFLKYADYVGFQPYVDPFLRIGKDKKYEKGYKSNFVCHQPFTRLSIIEDGRVSPCCLDYDQDLMVGDLSKQTIKEVWNSEKLENIRKTLRDGEFYKISRCACCEKAINGDQGIDTPLENLEPTI